MPRAYIAFGSNLGDREANIVAALGKTQLFLGELKVSGLYETEPMYVEDQPPFLNGALLGETTLKPFELLLELKAVERLVGRQVRSPNGPREIDLDLIWIEGVEEESSDGLQLPHPRSHERRFVLEPLYEIAPGLSLPGFGLVSGLLADPGVQSQAVRRVADAPILL